MTLTELARDGFQPILKHARWCFLKRPENLTPTQNLKLADVLRHNLRSVRAHFAQRVARGVLELCCVTYAGWFLDKWCTRALRSRLEPMKKVARTLRAHRPLILNWFRAKREISSGAVEGMTDSRTIKVVDVPCVIGGESPGSASSDSSPRATPSSEQCFTVPGGAATVAQLGPTSASGSPPETRGGGQAVVDMFSGTGMEEMVLNLKDMIPQMGRKTKRRQLKVPEALEALAEEEAAKRIDADKLTKEALRRAEEAGIIFIDEIDKVVGREGGGGGAGPDVSREGVQRDLLPIVEGSTVSTKYGPLKTDHVLFIAAGAFHVSKPKDMIPELQGRFPIRVELESLSNDDLVRILTEPENALTKQYTALLATEAVTLDIRPDAVLEIARVAALVNSRMENIGARRLHTIMELVLDDLAFEAPELGQTTVPITAAYVRERLEGVLKDEDLSQYVL